MPRVLSTLIERLEAFYVKMARENPNDPLLKRIPNSTRLARQIVQGL